jgi:competence protein ComEA
MTDTARLPPSSDSVVEPDDLAPAGDGGVCDREANAAARSPGSDGIGRRRVGSNASAAAGETAAVVDEQPVAADVALPMEADRELASAFGLRRRDQLVVAALVSATLVLAGLEWARLSGWGTRPVEIDRPPEQRYAYQLDPNTATWVEWMQLPEIGETLARRIVADREQRGPFHRIDDLDRVSGIGPKTIARIRPWLREPKLVDAAPAL